MAGYSRYWILFLLVFLSDQWTKTLVVERAEQLQTNPLVLLDCIDGFENLLEFTYITNPGAAWSMFSDYPEVLTVLALFALSAIFFFRKHLELQKKPQQWIFGLITGGIAGNLGDRLFREPAEVVDFIDFYLPILEYDYPVFNIADSAIFVGAISYLILGILEGKNEREIKMESNS